MHTIHKLGFIWTFSVLEVSLGRLTTKPGVLWHQEGQQLNHIKLSA